MPRMTMLGTWTKASKVGQDRVYLGSNLCQPLQMLLRPTQTSRTPSLLLPVNFVMEWYVLSIGRARLFFLGNNQPRFQIYRVAVRLLGDMSQVQLKINSHSKSHITRNIVFGITKSSDTLELVFSDGTEFAVLNTH